MYIWARQISLAGDCKSVPLVNDVRLPVGIDEEARATDLIDEGLGPNWSSAAVPLIT